MEIPAEVWLESDRGVPVFRAPCVSSHRRLSNPQHTETNDGRERQTQDQRRGRIRERSRGRPRPGNANRRIAIRPVHKRVPRGGECAVPEPAGL
jgi:hypothetical protein